MILLIKLVLAHLIGDFILQPLSWVKAKEKKKLKAWQFYAHLLIHFTLIMLLVWDFAFLLPALLIMFSHGILDAIKLHFKKEATERLWFAADQLLHLFLICIIWYFVEKPALTFSLNQVNLLYLTALVFITTPASIIIKTLISQWNPITDKPRSASLQHAGKYIGILERLMVFTFTVSNHWEAIGFLIAAKSVFRFGDLKESRDLKLTEYVLIGTLLSFGLAMGAGLVVSMLD